MCGKLWISCDLQQILKIFPMRLSWKFHKQSSYIFSVWNKIPRKQTALGWRSHLYFELVTISLYRWFNQQNRTSCETCKSVTRSRPVTCCRFFTWNYEGNYSENVKIQKGNRFITTRSNSFQFVYWNFNTSRKL